MVSFLKRFLMEQIKIAWIVFFFLFSLTLLFTWSKVYIISKKIKYLDALLARFDDLDEKKIALDAPAKKQPAL